MAGSLERCCLRLCLNPLLWDLKIVNTPTSSHFFTIKNKIKNKKTIHPKFAFSLSIPKLNIYFLPDSAQSIPHCSTFSFRKRTFFFLLEKKQNTLRLAASYAKLMFVKLQRKIAVLQGWTRKVFRKQNPWRRQKGWIFKSDSTNLARLLLVFDTQSHRFFDWRHGQRNTEYKEVDCILPNLHKLEEDSSWREADKLDQCLWKSYLCWDQWLLWPSQTPLCYWDWQGLSSWFHAKRESEGIAEKGGWVSVQSSHFFQKTVDAPCRWIGTSTSREA